MEWIPEGGWFSSRLRWLIVIVIVLDSEIIHYKNMTSRVLADIWKQGVQIEVS